MGETQQHHVIVVQIRTSLSLAPRRKEKGPFCLSGQGRQATCSLFRYTKNGVSGKRVPCINFDVLDQYLDLFVCPNQHPGSRIRSFTQVDEGELFPLLVSSASHEA